MAHEINDLKGIILLILLSMRTVVSTNIDCKGKGFHCVDSIHFMICVDVGGGVSSTIDDFVIPCPPTTECHENNRFECDFPKHTVIPLEVISVSTTSEISVTPLLTDSATTTTIPSTIETITDEYSTAVNLLTSTQVIASTPTVEASDKLTKNNTVEFVKSATQTIFSISNNTKNISENTKDTKQIVETLSDSKDYQNIKVDGEVLSKNNLKPDNLIEALVSIGLNSTDTFPDISTSFKIVTNSTDTSDDIKILTNENDKDIENKHLNNERDLKSIILNRNSDNIPKVVLNPDSSEHTYNIETKPYTTIDSHNKGELFSNIVTNIGNLPVYNISNNFAQVNKELQKELHLTINDNKNQANNSIFAVKFQHADEVVDTSTEYLHLIKTLENKTDTLISTKHFEMSTISTLSYTDNSVSDTSIPYMYSADKYSETDWNDSIQINTTNINVDELLNSQYNNSISNTTVTSMSNLNNKTIKANPVSDSENFSNSANMTSKHESITGNKDFLIATEALPISFSDNNSYTLDSIDKTKINPTDSNYWANSNNISEIDSVNNTFYDSMTDSSKYIFNITTANQIVQNTTTQITSLLDNIATGKLVNKIITSTEINTAQNANNSSTISEIWSNTGAPISDTESTIISYNVSTKTPIVTLQAKIGNNVLYDVTTAINSEFEISENVPIFKKIRNMTLLGNTSIARGNIERFIEPIYTDNDISNDSKTNVTQNTSEMPSVIFSNTLFPTNYSKQISDNTSFGSFYEITSTEKDTNTSLASSTIEIIASSFVADNKNADIAKGQENYFDKAINTNNSPPREILLGDIKDHNNFESTTSYMSPSITREPIFKININLTTFTPNESVNYISTSISTTSNNIESSSVEQNLSVTTDSSTDYTVVQNEDSSILETELNSIYNILPERVLTNISTDITKGITGVTVSFENKSSNIVINNIENSKSSIYDLKTKANVSKNTIDNFNVEITTEIPMITMNKVDNIVHSSVNESTSNNLKKKIEDEQKSTTPNISYATNHASVPDTYTKNENINGEISGTSQNTENIDKLYYVKTTDNPYLSTELPKNTSNNIYVNKVISTTPTSLVEHPQMPPTSDDINETSVKQYVTNYSINDSSSSTEKYINYVTNIKVTDHLSASGLVNEESFQKTTSFFDVTNQMNEKESEHGTVQTASGDINAVTEVYDIQYDKKNVLSSINVTNESTSESRPNASTSIFKKDVTNSSTFKATNFGDSIEIIKALPTSKSVIEGKNDIDNIKSLNNYATINNLKKLNETSADSLNISEIEITLLPKIFNDTTRIFVKDSNTVSVLAPGYNISNSTYYPEINSTEMPKELDESISESTTISSKFSSSTHVPQTEENKSTGLLVALDGYRTTLYNTFINLKTTTEKPIYSNLATTVNYATSVSADYVINTYSSDIKPTTVKMIPNVEIKTKIPVIQDEFKTFNKNVEENQILKSGFVTNSKDNLSNNNDSLIFDLAIEKPQYVSSVSQNQVTSETRIDSSSEPIPSVPRFKANQLELKDIVVFNNSDNNIGTKKSISINEYELGNLVSLDGNQNLTFNEKQDYLNIQENLDPTVFTDAEEMDSEDLDTTNIGISELRLGESSKNNSVMDGKSNKSVLSKSMNSLTINVSLNKQSKSTNNTITPTSKQPTLKTEITSTNKTYTNVTMFHCLNHTRGKYADSKDCRKFYICVGNLKPIIGICPNNTVFSDINKQCTRNLSHCVRNNQFRCLLEGRFSDYFKDNIYYICVKNSPSTFVRYRLQCQKGYHLNKMSVKCENNVVDSVQSISSMSEISDLMNDQTTSELKVVTNKDIDDFVCRKEGKFPHSKDVRKYYVCTNVKGVYRRKIKKCSSDDVYDKKKRKCIEVEKDDR